MWEVVFHSAFAEEFADLPATVRIDMRSVIRALSTHGPAPGRPHADTLKGSRFANMKELRFRSLGGPWRVAYAFDPDRQAVILVAGLKGGTGQDLFYRRFIATADKRFGSHLETDKGGKT